MSKVDGMARADPIQPRLSQRMFPFLERPEIELDSGGIWHWLADAGPDALLLVDAEGRITYANTHAHTVFGYEQGSLVKRSVEELIPAELRGAHGAHRQAYVAKPTLREMGNRSMALYGLRADGTRFPAEIRLASLVSGSVTFTAASVRDATEHQQITSRLAAARAVADSANESKSRFLAAVSHDLRQPLQALQLVSATLRRNNHDAVTLSVLQLQEQAVRTMSDLVNAVLNVSKLESGTVQPVVEDFLVAEVLEDGGEFPELARAKGLKLEITAPTIYVKTDRALLRQLVANLVSNAIKYTDAGHVALCCRRAADNWVEIQVEDTGIGIPAEALDSVFEDFVQIERPHEKHRGGVGLGLGTVRRIAALLNLPVRVTSAPGVGTTFAVRVPLGYAQSAVGRAAARSVSAPAAPCIPIGPQRILFIEDNEALRRATVCYLELEGYDVYAADSVGEVEAFLSAWTQPPAIIISDYQLGHGFRGTDAIKLVRDRFGEHIPAIILTGDTSLASRSAAKLSATALLNKPVNVEELAARMAELMHGSSTRLS
jgi:PAS domain S-box-containing protein